MTQKPVKYNENDQTYIFECPHCDLEIQVLLSELRCHIFRHGVYKHNNEQMNPHAPKNVCDQVFRDGMIYGCGKPFRFIDGPPPYVVECDYI